MKQRAFAVLALCAALASAARAQDEAPGEAQARLRNRFADSGLAVGGAFPAVDVFDAAGGPVNTASLKGFTTVVVSGCLT
ncbi:MAG: hypothetical protein H6509_03390 [Bryobacterales bacterium]|nr:hypothetical protein [Bryobacterales bacterium]